MIQSKPRKVETTNHQSNRLPLCYPEPPQPSSSQHHHQIGLLNELSSCRPVSCASFSHRTNCLGVPGCEWCQLTVRKTTSELDSDSGAHAVRRRRSEENGSLPIEMSDDILQLGKYDHLWALLSDPRCLPHHECPGGVMGGASPYPRGLAPQPHHKGSQRITPRRNMPLAPGT